MDLWTPEQHKNLIGIEQVFEEFCEIDPEMSRLNSTRPDRKSNPKKFEEWYVRYCPVMDDTTRRFVELFRKKILVAMTLHEIVLPPEYWVTTLASLTITAGKVEGLLLDDPDKHLANCRVVLYKEDWKKWKAKGRSKRSGLYSPAKLRVWYINYVKVCEVDGKSPSRADDVKAARAPDAMGEGVTRDAVWDLRNELAPEEWKKLAAQESDENLSGNVSKLN